MTVREKGNWKFQTTAQCLRGHSAVLLSIFIGGNAQSVSCFTPPLDCAIFHSLTFHFIISLGDVHLLIHSFSHINKVSFFCLFFCHGALHKNQLKSAL